MKCAACGQDGFSQYNLRQHKDSGPCQVEATKRQMRIRRWDRVGSAYMLCKRVGIEMERAPTRYRSGGSSSGRVQMGWWAPRWVTMILGALHLRITEREDLLRRAHTDLATRQEYITAFEVLDVLNRREE
jgi:hypothetical protein